MLHGGPSFDPHDGLSNGATVNIGNEPVVDVRDGSLAVGSFLDARLKMAHGSSYVLLSDAADGFARMVADAAPARLFGIWLSTIAAGEAVVATRLVAMIYAAWSTAVATCLVTTIFTARSLNMMSNTLLCVQHGSVTGALSDSKGALSNGNLRDRFMIGAPPVSLIGAPLSSGNASLHGSSLGIYDGLIDGYPLGVCDGTIDGSHHGTADGSLDGSPLDASDGSMDGSPLVVKDGSTIWMDGIAAARDQSADDELLGIHPGLLVGASLGICSWLAGWLSSWHSTFTWWLTNGLLGGPHALV